MASLPFWDSTDDEEASVWDECELGGFALPGICEVEVHAKRKLDVQEGSGTDYDTVADKGQRSADVEIVCTVWEREQWEGWQDEVMPKLWPRAGKGRPDPLELVHPMADFLRVNAMVIQDIKPKLDKDGVMTITIKGYAWGKPKPSPVKVADKAKGAGETKADADKATEQAPFDPNASLLDTIVNSLDPKRESGKPRGQGAPSRDPNLLKP